MSEESVKLSRLAAQALDMPLMQRMSLDERHAFTDSVAKAKTLDKLPKSTRDLLEKALGKKVS